MCHPTSTGVLSIFEPRYVSMLAQHSRFVHVLSRDVVAVIPELAKDSLDGGLPRVGVLVNVRSVQEDGQTRLVAYEGMRRVRLLMLEEAEPYTVRVASSAMPRGMHAMKDAHALHAVCKISACDDMYGRVLPASHMHGS